MEVRYLKEEEFDLWNEFVDESPEGSIYGKSWYLDALQSKYKILVTINDKEIYAGIVLTKNEIGTYSNPLLCKYLGIFYKRLDGNKQKNESKRVQLAKELIEEMKGIKTFDYTFHPNYKNWLPFYWAGFKQTTKYSYRLDLNKDINELYKNFHKDHRYEIRKAEDSGVKLSYQYNFESFYQLIDYTFKSQGSSAPFNRMILENYINELQKQKSIMFINSQDEKEITATLACVYDNNTAFLILNGSNDIGRKKGHNTFLIFQTLNFFIGKVNVFDFEGSMIKGIESFYRKFGGDFVEYYQIYNPSLINNLKLKTIPMYKRLKYGK
jgi:hypothetical protein